MHFFSLCNNNKNHQIQQSTFFVLLASFFLCCSSFLLFSKNSVAAENNVKPALIQPIVKQVAKAKASHNQVSLTQEEKQWIADNPITRVGATKDWPPFDYVTTLSKHSKHKPNGQEKLGKHTGFIADYLNLIGKKTGLHFDFQVNAWNDNLNAIQQSKLDVIGGASYNKERTEFLNYSEPFISLSPYFFAREDIALSTLKDLNGKRVAIPKGYAAIDILKKHFPKINIITTPTLVDAIDAVTEKRADLLFDYYAVLQYSLQKEGVNNIVPFKSARYLGEEPLYIVTRKNAPVLNSIIKKGMQAITEDEFKRLEKRWLGSVSFNKSLGLTQDEQAWLKQNHIIYYGVEKDWAPFNFVDKTGEHQGLSRSFLDKISKMTGIEFLPVVKPWRKLLKETREGKLHLLPAILYTKKRGDYYQYTQSYATNTPYFFVRENINATTISSLNGKTAAIPKGYIYDDVLRKHYPNIKIKEYDNMGDAINAVLQKKADILVDSYTAMSYLLTERGINNIEALEPLSANVTNSIHMAVAKRYAPLASIIDKALAQIPATEKQTMLNKWIVSEQQSRLQNQLILTQAERDWLLAHPKISFAGDPKWLPIEAFDEQGQYIGILAAYLKVIERALDIKFDIKQTQTWSQTLDLAKSKQINVISKAVNVAPLPGYVYSDAIFSSPIVIVANENYDYIDDLDELKGKTIGVVSEYSYVDQIKKAYPQLKFVAFESTEDGLLGLSTGKVDTFLSTLSNASYLISDMGLSQLRVVGKTNFKTDIGFSVAKEYAPLVPILNKTIAAIDHKTKAKILDSWGKQRFVEKTNYKLLAKVVAGFLTILFIIWLWNRQLSKEIEKRKVSEENLANLNQRFKLAAQAVSFGVWELIYKKNETIPTVVFDEKMSAIYNLNVLDTISWEDWLAMIAPQDRLNFQANIQSLLKHGGSSELEFTILPQVDDTFKKANTAAKKPQQRAIYAGMSVEHTGVGQHKIKKIVGINWDISQIKRTEKLLEKAKIQADSANTAKSAFLANMSHEIRTPMNAILGFTELLDEQLEDKRLKAFVKTIRSAGNNLLSLINDILDLSKIEAGKLEINKTPCNPHALFTDVGNIFMMRVREKNLDFLLDIDESIPESLNLDEVRVRQILFNLIGNAVKFTETGHICVRAKAANEDEIRSTVDLIIEVEDTGIGIPKEQQEKVFKAFEQNQGQDIRKYGGTGLGLSISVRLAKMMSGDISVISEPKVGTTFTLLLREIDVASVRAPEPVEEPSISQTLVFDESKILVVDDVKENRDLLVHNFENTNIHVFTAQNGKEAVDLVQEHEFKMIFMDIRMPIMDGYEAAHHIKQSQKIPIVALTASVMTSEFEKMKREDFDGYLRKPVLRKDLFESVAQFVSHTVVTQTAQDKKNITALSDDEKSYAAAVIKQLKELIPTCHQLEQTNNIQEIAQFAKAILEQLADKPIYVMEQFVTTLQEDLDSFNIVGIKKALQEYPSLLATLENQLLTDEFFDN